MSSRVLVDAGSWVRAGQVLATVDRSVQAQQAAQLAAQVDVGARRCRARPGQLRARPCSRAAASCPRRKSIRRRRRATPPTPRSASPRPSLRATRAADRPAQRRRAASGLVLARSVEVGQIVSPGRGALFRLAEGGQMEMRAQLPQQDIAWSTPGCRRASPRSARIRAIQGSVWQVAPVIDPQSRQGEVRISGALRSGDPAGRLRRSRDQAGGTTAPLLPQSAVLSDDQGQLRLHRQQQERGRAPRVKIGRSTTGVTIAEGLSGQEASSCRPDRSSIPGQKVAPEAAGRPLNGPGRVVEHELPQHFVLVHPQPGPPDRAVRRPDAGRACRVHGMQVNNNPDIDFPAAIVASPAGRGAERDGNPGHPAGRIRDPRSQRRRRNQQHRQRGQQQHLRPVRDRHADRPRGQRRSRRRRPDPRQPSRRHPRAASHPCRYRRRPDPLRRRVRRPT